MLLALTVKYGPNATPSMLPVLQEIVNLPVTEGGSIPICFSDLAIRPSTCGKNVPKNAPWSIENTISMVGEKVTRPTIETKSM
jgi:hypothetical protein